MMHKARIVFKSSVRGGRDKIRDYLESRDIDYKKGTIDKGKIKYRAKGRYHIVDFDGNLNDLDQEFRDNGVSDFANVALYPPKGKRSIVFESE